MPFGFGVIRISPSPPLPRAVREPRANTPGNTRVDELPSWGEIDSPDEWDSSRSPSPMQSQPIVKNWITCVGKLEGDLEKAQADLREAQSEMENLRNEIEELKRARAQPCLNCVTLQKNYDDCQVHFEILVAKSMRERDAAERNRLVDRRRIMNLPKEVIELTEGNFNTRRLFMFNEELVRQTHTLLDEALYEEEIVLSALVRAEVRETWIKIQANNGVQMNIMVLNNDGVHVPLTCVLHTTHSQPFNMCTGANWRADRTHVVLHFGNLVITKLGDKAPLERAFAETLVRGTTQSALLVNVFDNGLAARLEEKRNRA